MRYLVSLAPIRTYTAVAFIFVASVLSANASAAIVTIDFETLPDQTGEICGPVCTTDPAQWVEYGFIIEGSDAVANGSFPGGVVAGIGYAPTPAEFGARSLLMCGTCGPLEFTIAQQDGLTFDLLSFDLTAAFPGGGDDWTIVGALAGGGEVTTSITTSAYITATFDSQWVGLESVTILAAPQNALDYRLDNIVVQAVPVPAAVWLFGSALAALGWLRRKQTV